MPLRLIDSSVWISYLRPRPDPRIVKAVQHALTTGEAATAAPIVVEVLSGIRDPREYAAREDDFRSLPLIPIDGEAMYIAARIGEALASAGKIGKTVDLLLAGAAIHAGAELWSLPDEHFKEIRALIDRKKLKVPRPFHLVFLK